MIITFPPPSAVVDHYVDNEEGKNIFWKATKQLKCRTFKLECAQTFQEPGNPSWEALVTGDYTRSIELIEENRAILERQRKPFDEADVPFYRVRIIQYPLSTYLKWELEHFRLNVEQGEQISIVDTAGITDIELETPLEDFVLFDEFLMLAYDYSPDGVAQGAHVVTNSNYLHEVSKLADKLLERALPLSRLEYDRLIPLE